MTALVPFSKEAINFIQQNKDADPYKLSLRKSPFPEVDIRTISRQVIGRKIAQKKFPFLLEFDQYRYPKKESLEQASSQRTAVYKSRFVSGKSFVDLTGGMGIDSFLLGKKFSSCAYVEPDVELCSLAEYNFSVLGLDQCEIVQTSCQDFLKTQNKEFDWAYIDPSRRVKGGRKTSIHEYEPNIGKQYESARSSKTRQK